MITPLLLAVGSSVLIKGKDGTEALFKVLRRKDRGYLLQASDGEEPRHHSDADLLRAHLERRLRYFRANLHDLDERLAEVVQRAWEAWPEDLRRTALRRREFCLEVKRIRHEHATEMSAFAAAADQIWNLNASAWEEQDRIDRAVTDSVRRARPRRNPVDAEAQAQKPAFSKPTRHAVRDWYKRWAANGEDVKLLIPLVHRRGNRTKRFACSSSALEDDDTYKLMTKVMNEEYLVLPRKTKRYCYKLYRKLCEGRNIPPVSEHTHNKSIRLWLTAAEEHAARYGKRDAYLRFGIFDRRKPPDRPLQEVEVDHCLVDINVIHEGGRRLGRVWLTVFLDRATRMIIGAHLSFEVPSYASLQRAMIHAFWPKDVSGIEGLRGDWPTFGVPEVIICDNGKEFHSKSLKAAEASLDFRLIFLPVKTPWLKGAVERLFRTIGVQVFSFEEGTTLSRTKDVYDPLARARFTLPELTSKFVRWVVDDYHETVHPAIKCKPVDKWRELTGLYPPRPVPSYDDIIQLTGQVAQKQIGKHGISLFGLHYYEKEKLSSLLRRRGSLGKEWQIRVDPYNIGEVHLLDDEEGRWITLPCMDADYARGVSKARHAMHMTTAKKNLAKGTPITVRHLEEAKRICEAEVDAINSRTGEVRSATRAARYQCNGEVMTPVGEALSCVTSHRALAAVVQPAAGEIAPDPAPEPLRLPPGPPDLSELIAKNLERYPIWKH